MRIYPTYTPSIYAVRQQREPRIDEGRPTPVKYAPPAVLVRGSEHRCPGCNRRVDRGLWHKRCREVSS